MNIAEAIKVLGRDRFDNPDYHLQDFQEAIDLGIEALKVIKGYREIKPYSYPKLLPGETEEEVKRR